MLTYLLLDRTDVRRETPVAIGTAYRRRASVTQCQTAPDPQEMRPKAQEKETKGLKSRSVWLLKKSPGSGSVSPKGSDSIAQGNAPGLRIPMWLKP